MSASDFFSGMEKSALRRPYLPEGVYPLVEVVSVRYHQADPDNPRDKTDAIFMDVRVLSPSTGEGAAPAASLATIAFRRDVWGFGKRELSECLSAAYPDGVPGGSMEDFMIDATEKNAMVGARFGVQILACTSKEGRSYTKPSFLLVDDSQAAPEPPAPPAPPAPHATESFDDLASSAGWLAHPTPGYYYRGQRVISTEDLRVELGS